jgi:hypothetical protein
MNKTVVVHFKRLLSHNDRSRPTGGGRGEAKALNNLSRVFASNHSVK